MAYMTMTLDRTTKQKLCTDLKRMTWRGQPLLEVARAINAVSEGSSTLEDIARRLQTTFGKDSFEGKFMDHFLAKIDSVKDASGTPTDILAAAQRELTMAGGFEPYTEKAVGGRQFDKTLDHILVGFFNSGGSILITQKNLSDESFAAIQKAAKGETLPSDKIDGMDQAAWSSQYKDFITAYQAATTDGGFAPSKEVFLQMIKSQVREINNAGGLSNEDLRKQAAEAANRISQVHSAGTSVGGAGASKGGSSKGKFKSITKCPYRALALAMKMINQLAKMMCSSFQKTIGAGGFYKGMDSAEFNKFIGYGQRIQERGEELEHFFANANLQESNYQELYKELKIKDGDDKAKADALREKCKEDPEVVERALRVVGLQAFYDKWVYENGIEKTQEEKIEGAKRGAEMLQLNCNAALDNLKAIDAKTGSKKYKEFAEKVKNGGVTREIVSEMQGIVDDYNTEQEKKAGQLSGHGSGKGKKLTDEADREILFNKIEIERLRKVGGAKAEEDIQYLEARNLALQGVLNTSYSPEALQDLDLNRAAIGTYIVNTSQNILDKVVSGTALTAHDLNFMTRAFGKDCAAQLAKAGKEGVPDHISNMIYKLFNDPEAMVGKFVLGKEAAFIGDGTPPRQKAQTRKLDDAGMMQRLGVVFSDKESLKSAPEIAAFADDFTRLNEIYLLEQKEKASGK